MSEHPFAFAIRQRVRFGETDMQGVVYYANYLLYAEIGRHALLRHLGLTFGDLHRRGFDFTIGEARVRYRAPLRYDDEYDVRTRVAQIRRASWAFEYGIDRADGTRCADASTVQVLIDRATFKPASIPDDLRALLGRGT